MQQVCGIFLCYGQAVDLIMLFSLSANAPEQAKPRKQTLKTVEHFFDYAVLQEDAIFAYHTSNMVLTVHSDASYLSKPKATIRAGGHFFMAAEAESPHNNGAAHIVAQTINEVMASATEAEIGAMYINTRKAVLIREILIEMGHAQPPTLLQTDNSAAYSLVSKKVQPRRTKGMDMRFY